jgi:hypothetical protein
MLSCHFLLRHERIPPELVVSNCCSIATFVTAYESNIWPCRNISEWETMDEPDVAPLVYEKKVGRPPKARKMYKASMAQSYQSMV